MTAGEVSLSWSLIWWTGEYSLSTGPIIPALWLNYAGQVLVKKREETFDPSECVYGT